MSAAVMGLYHSNFIRTNRLVHEPWLYPARRTHLDRNVTAEISEYPLHPAGKYLQQFTRPVYGGLAEKDDNLEADDDNQEEDGQDS